LNGKPGNEVSTMKRNDVLFVQGVIVLAAALVLVFSIQFVIGVFEEGFGIGRFTHLTLDGAKHLNNVFNRNLNQLLGTVFTAVAIGVSLTANMYSFKFLEFFIKDRVNGVVLLFVLITNAANTFSGFLFKADMASSVHTSIIFVLTTVCFSMILPYMYYLFRFLHPQTLLSRIENEMNRALRSARTRPHDASKSRDSAEEMIEHIGNIAIRSIERGDRNTAIESVLTLERVMQSYWSRKAGLPDDWFKAEKHYFLGFSSGVINEMKVKRTWVEMKALGEFRHVFQAASQRMSEVVSSVVETLCRLGLHNLARRDKAVRNLVIAYFNTMMRVAINRKDVRSAFLLLGQYRDYAEGFKGECPEAVEEIAYYFRYYGGAAREAGMAFVTEVAAHDLGKIVEDCWESGGPNRGRLLSEFLRFDGEEAQPLAGVKKAQALLASYFLMHGEEEPATRIRVSFNELAPGFMATLTDDLLHVTQERYWEVNERGTNMDYVPPQRREQLRQFLDSVVMGGRRG
jgi:hypothetical protein